MDFNLCKETPITREMVKAMEEGDEKLLRKDDVVEMIRTYYKQKIDQGRCFGPMMVDMAVDLQHLVDDLPEFKLGDVTRELKEKRYYAAAEIVESGWK